MYKKIAKYNYESIKLNQKTQRRRVTVESVAS